MYASYVGVLHLGYLDGALVSWAASGRPRIRREFPTATVFVSGILGAVSLIAVGIWLAFDSAPWGWLIAPITVFAVVGNLTTICLHALQADKRFKQLSLLTLLQPSLLLFAVCALASQHDTSARSLLSVYIGATAITLAVAWRGVSPTQDWRWPSFSTLVSSSRIYLRSGCMILLANLATNLILGADRIIISSRFPIQQFAIYSFAATFFYSAFFVVLSTAKVFFPYLSTEIAGIQINKVYGLAERLVITLWILGLAAFFPIAWLTQTLLPGYTTSIPIIRILLLGTGFAALTQLLHSNFFRVMRRPGALLFVGATATVTVFAALTYTQRFGTLTLIAWTTVISVLVWWLLGDSLISVTVGRSHSRTFISLLLMCASGAVFLLCSRNTHIVSALAYLTFAVTAAALLLRRSLRAISNLRGSNVATLTPEVSTLP